MSHSSQDTYGGLVFSRMPTRERKMVWSRYENDTTFAAGELTFPATPVLDDFNRADSTLDAPWGDGSYYGGIYAAFAVVSNTIKSDGSGGSGGQFVDAWYDCLFSADQEAYCTASALAANDQVEVTARLTDLGNSSTWNGYAVMIRNSSSEAKIFRYTDGASSVLWQGTQAFAAGDSLGIRCVGPLIQYWYKASAGSWTKIAQVVDYTHSAPGRIAFYAESTTAALDNVGGGEYWDRRKERGIWFNTPVAVEPETEWAHPFFHKVRSYTPVVFYTGREVVTGGNFTPVDYKVSSPNTFNLVAASNKVGTFDGPIAGYRSVFCPTNYPGNLISITSVSSLPTTQITVAAWARQWRAFNWPNWVTHDWAGNGSWLLYASTTAALFGVVNGSGAQQNAACPSSQMPFADGKWHFLVGTYDGTTVKIYVDGVLGSTQTVSAGIALDSSGSLNLCGGALDRCQGPSFVLGTALTQQQVTELYNLGLSHPLVADSLDRYHITSISGIDSPEVRDGRADNPGNHGEAAYQAFLGGKNISIAGEIRASNLPRLRHMIKRLREETNADQGVGAALDNIFWKQFSGTLTVYDALEAEPVQFSGRVIDMKIAEQQTTDRPVRDFRMTIRVDDPESGITGAVQLGTTTNLIGGATYFDPGLQGTLGTQFDALVRIGNYPTGATSRITGDLVIQNGQGDQITFTNPTWGTDEWWEIDSRDGSVRKNGLNGSTNSRFSTVKLSGTSPQFLRASSSPQFWTRTGTVSTGTPKFALFLPDNPYL